VKFLRWGWLFLAVAPGCLLVQPLDGAASSEGGDDSSSSAGASAAGSSGSHAGATSNPRAGAPGVSGARGVSGAPGASGAPAVGGKLAPFVGTWTAVSGTLAILCPGVPASTEAVTGTETWAPGTVSDLVQPGFEADCDLNANVSARTATALPGQTCTESSTDDTSGDTITQDFTIESFKFVVSSDGKSATQTFAGNDDYTDVTTGGELVCMFTETASFTK
jgi:hypothetical protein